MTVVNIKIDSTMARYWDELMAISESISDTGLYLNRLYDAIETGKTELDDLMPRIRELQEHQNQLQARKCEIECHLSDRKVEMADLETVSEYIDDFYSLLNEGSFLERKAFIRSFIKEIKVTGNEVEINYTVPVLPDKLNMEKVLHTVHSSGRYWA